MSEREVISVPEAGQRLGISRNSAYDAARRGEIPTIRIGKRLLVPIVAFQRLIEGKETADVSQQQNSESET